MKLSIIITTLLICGCSAPAIKPQTVTVDAFTLHMITDREQCPWDKFERGCCYERDRIIYIEVDRNGYISDKVLGHEIKHLINYKYPDILSNPDEGGSRLLKNDTKIR